MDVYLVPVGATRYELYCEVPDEPDDGGRRRAAAWALPTHGPSFPGNDRGGRTGAPPGKRPSALLADGSAALRARTLRWVAESIAEQKLLWHLRKQDAASFHYPDDLERDRPSRFGANSSDGITRNTDSGWRSIRR